MQTIKLCSGKTVELNLTIGSLTQVKNILNIHLLDVGKGSQLEQTLDNQIDLCNVLYLLCKKSCESKNPVITDIEFGEGMDGGKLEIATKQFIDELQNFLPPHKRAILAHSIKMTTEIQEQLATTTIKKMEEMREGIYKTIESEINKRMTIESLESTFLEQK